MQDEDQCNDTYLWKAGDICFKYLAEAFCHPHAPWHRPWHHLWSFCAVWGGSTRPKPLIHKKLKQLWNVKSFFNTWSLKFIGSKTWPETINSLDGPLSVSPCTSGCRNLHVLDCGGGSRVGMLPSHRQSAVYHSGCTLLSFSPLGDS